jgi:hypothetical protein
MAGVVVAPVPGSIKAEDCPKRHLHTKCPPGYLSWHEWAEKKARRHYQVRCPGCGLYVIWKRKSK